VLLLVTDTSKPALPAGLPMLRFPVTELPPATDVASKLSDARFGRFTERVADSEYTPLIAVIT